MYHLLIARFTMDDIPLRLYGHYAYAAAEDDAKAIHADPKLLRTKWARSVDKWPLPPRRDFVGAIVLSIGELDGYPSRVRFDSTAEPAHPPVPEGHVEITDPRHNVRVGIDYYADRDAENGVLWKLVQGSSGNLCGFRFCCPADKHPDLQSATATPLPAETDERAILREASEILVKQQIALTNDIEILRKSNADLLAENNTLVATRTQLHKTISEMLEERSRWVETHVPELQGRYDQCKERVFELEAQVGFLNDRNAALVSKNEELQQQQNTDLVSENVDLRRRLNATKARADRATDLEGKLRGTAQLLLTHFQRLEDRAKWAFRFADEELMPLAYAKAMLHCQRKFAEEFQGFLSTYPHVLPDIPAKHWPVDDTDDETND